VRELLKREVEQKEFSFLEEHPLIRSLHDYGTVVRVSFREGDPWDQRPKPKGDDGSNGLRIEGRSTNGHGPAMLSTITTNGHGAPSAPTDQFVQQQQRPKELPGNGKQTGAPRERAQETDPVDC
jgi:hypothetical protein